MWWQKQIPSLEFYEILSKCTIFIKEIIGNIKHDSHGNKGVLGNKNITVFLPPFGKSCNITTVKTMRRTEKKC